MIDYFQYFCEENAYRLGEYLQSSYDSSHIYIVWISNSMRQVVLWNQRAGKDYVVWDYHVIVIVKCPDKSLVYDLDSILEFPTNFTDFESQALKIQLNDRIPTTHSRVFRVLELKDYLEKFSSDRSHMINSGVKFPTVPCIGTGMNIEKFIDMNDPEYGTVMDELEFRNFFKNGIQ